MKIEDTIAEGDKVTVRITVEGTHKGGQLGVAPTGRRVRFEGTRGGPHRERADRRRLE